MKTVAKVMSVFLFVILFLPTCGVKGFFSLSVARVLFGYKHVLPGNFWVIFMFIIPIVIIGALYTDGYGAEYTVMAASVCNFIGWMLYGDYVSGYLVRTEFFYYIALIINVAIFLITIYTHFADRGSSYSNSNTYLGKKDLSNGKWECLRCGSINVSLADYCTECGAQRRGTINPGVKSAFEQKNSDLHEGTNAWRCAFCNNLTPNNIGFCKCGASRGDTKKKLEENNSQAISTSSVQNQIQTETPKNVKTQEHNDVNKETTINMHKELSKYKKMLEDELITQEDYDKKKKELLKL